jgi:hypothetical protein
MEQAGLVGAFLCHESRHRYHHHVVLESLGCMHGDDLHEIAIALQAQLAFFGCDGLRREFLPGKPFQQAMHARRHRRASLQ